MTSPVKATGGHSSFLRVVVFDLMPQLLRWWPHSRGRTPIVTY